VRKKNREARSIARRLVTSKTYLRQLRGRLRDGTAGQIEIWLWRYAFGEPKKDEAELERERKRFAAMRAQVQELLRAAPERAHVMDGAVQRAPRLLPLPQREPEVVDPVETDDGTGDS